MKAVVDRDLTDSYYTFLVDVHVAGFGLVRNRVTDPYAVSLTTDSRRGYVANLQSPRLKPSDWDRTQSPQRVHAATDAVIYELHVRDFSISDKSVPEDERGSFLAFTRDSLGTRHLRRLAEAYRVSTTYSGFDGQEREVPEPTLRAGLDASELGERPARTVPRHMGSKHGGSGLPGGGAVLVPPDLGLVGNLHLAIGFEPDRPHHDSWRDAAREPIAQVRFRSVPARRRPPAWCHCASPARATATNPSC